MPLFGGQNPGRCGELSKKLEMKVVTRQAVVRDPEPES